MVLNRRTHQASSCKKIEEVTIYRAYKHFAKMSFRYFEAASHASVYSRFRPSPPPALVKKMVAYITEKIPEPLVEAVDVGCGGGQSTTILAPYFKKVLGFDPSEKAISEANKRHTLSNITYRVGSAEKIDCPDSSVQLVTAGQACHWFNLPAFYTEAGRILVPNGVIALYGYKLPRPVYQQTELGDIVDKYYNVVFGEHVLPESKMVYIDNYKQDIFNKLPFVKEPLLRDESIFSEHEATVSDLVGYVRSWSAYQNFEKHEGEEKATALLHAFENEIMDLVGACGSPAETPLRIKYSYFLLLGRKHY